MMALKLLGYALSLIGFLSAVFGLWSVAGGLRVVVSRRIDERRESMKAVRFGIPFAVGGIVLLFGGIWLANWAAG
jgi:prepilin signal peptidase PulO-like enzyme (type II secretory pathway)